jgi:hypothetical protein
MSNDAGDTKIGDEIRDLRMAVGTALVAIRENQTVDLPNIGDMVERVTKQLQEQILTMDPAERDAVLIELTEILTGFGTLEEAIKANADFPEDEAQN